MAKSFDALVRRTTSNGVRKRAAKRTQELLTELLLGEIRAQVGKSQAELARDLGIKQPSLSKLENQSDMQISTLRKIIAALGGELEVTARFPNATVLISPFSSTSTNAGGHEAGTASASPA